MQKDLRPDLMHTSNRRCGQSKKAGRLVNKKKECLQIEYLCANYVDIDVPS